MNKNKLGLDWAANGRTLLIGMQTTCHFCTDSGPFFQKLAGASKGTKIIAVLPQSLDDSKQYLAKIAVTVDEVKSAPLAAISVTGTPTMVLVDARGIVRNVWIGKLAEDTGTWRYGGLHCAACTLSDAQGYIYATEKLP